MSEHPGMATTRAKRKPADRADPVTSRDKELLLKLLETMVLTRAVEDRMVSMYRSGDLLGSLYSGHWHEAISVGTAAALRPDDFLAPIHRDLGAHLCRGMGPWQGRARLPGTGTSPTRGGRRT